MERQDAEKIVVISVFAKANNIPSGERYELCRSVHAEQNAIISASKENMVGATLYLTGIDSKTGEYVKGLSADCCSMCKRMIINSGIEKVIIRLNETEFKTVLVNEWIEQDDTVWWKSKDKKLN